MIWTDDNLTWYACIPNAPYQYNSKTLGPFATREQAIAAMDEKWKEVTE